MPHRKYDQKAIQNAQKDVDYFEELIQKAKLMSRGGEKSIELAVELIQDMELDARLRKDMYLKSGTNDHANLARSYLAKQEAYQDVITLFKKPDAMIKVYEQEKERNERYIKSAKQNAPPQREN